MNKENGRLAKGVSVERSATTSPQRPKRAPNPVAKRDKAPSTAHRRAATAGRSSKSLTRVSILRTFLLGRMAMHALRYVQGRRLSSAVAATHQTVRKHPVPAMLLGAAVGYLLTRTKVKWSYSQAQDARGV